MVLSSSGFLKNRLVPALTTTTYSSLPFSLKPRYISQLSNTTRVARQTPPYNRTTQFGGWEWNLLRIVRFCCIHARIHPQVNTAGKKASHASTGSYMDQVSSHQQAFEKLLSEEYGVNVPFSNEICGQFETSEEIGNRKLHDETADKLGDSPLMRAALSPEPQTSATALMMLSLHKRGGSGPPKGIPRTAAGQPLIYGWFSTLATKCSFTFSWSSDSAKSAPVKSPGIKMAFSTSGC